MVVNDKNFFNLLAIIGGNHSELYNRILAALIVAVYFVSMIFYIVVTCHFMFTQFTVSISYLILDALSVFLWFSLFKKRKQISSTVQELYYFRKRYNIVDNASTSKQKLVTIFILMLFILCQLRHHFEAEAELKFWNLGFKFPKGKLKLSYIIFVNSVSFIVNSFPVLITLILSIIFYKWGETLNAFNKALRLHLCSANRCKNIDIFVDFFKMTNVLRELNCVLNFSLLCIVLYSLFNLFVYLYDLLNWPNTYSLIIISVICIGWSVMMLLMYSICCSMIPENLSEIKLTAREKLKEHVFGLAPIIPQNVLMCLKTIEAEKVVYISVCGLFRLTKGFILPAIGSVFTYDLLIINMLMGQNNEC